MARRNDSKRQRGGAGLALLGVLALIAGLIVIGWRLGLLAVRPGGVSMRMPQAPALPLPKRGHTPDPAPMPLPKPGPGVEQR